MGKPGSKLKDFQIRWLGSYDECIEVKVEEAKSRFSGKYCTLSVEFMEEVVGWTIIGVATITHLRTCVIKIVTFKGGNLM